MTGLNLTADQQLTLDRVDGILAKVGSRLSSDLIRKDHIGCELHEDLQMYGAMTAGDLLQWNHYISNLFRTIKDLLDLFDEVTIAEYWENTFTLKFKRNERLSIGYLFGYFDDIVISLTIRKSAMGLTSIQLLRRQSSRSSIPSRMRWT